MTMDMKRLVILCAALLFVTACASSSTNRDTLGANFRTGSEGLYFNFASNLPPARIYDDQKLDILVEVENRGATNIGGAGDRIYLTGFDPSIITGIPFIGQQIPFMNGKDVYGPGDKSYVSFSGVPVSLFSLNIDKYTPRLQLTACYLYETLATANICIDPDPTSFTARDKVCKPADVSLGSQGAPVAVSTVQVDATPGTTRFEILIQNVGKGQPFRSGLMYLQKCSPNDPTSLAYNELGYVELVDVAIAGRSIKNSCRPMDQGHIRLSTSGPTHLFCQFDNIPGSSAYTSPLTVTLRYGYRETMQRDLTVIQSTR
jgi:hypothetical protein